MPQRIEVNLQTAESTTVELTQAEIDAALAATAAEAALQAQTALDAKDVEKIEKAIKALALLTRDYTNALKAEVRGLAVLLVNKGVITAGEANALLAYDGSGAGDQKTLADLKADYAAKYDSLP